MKHIAFQMLSVALVGSLLGSGSAAIAKPEDPNHLNLSVSDQFLYDDNLYRLPSQITDLTGLVGPNSTRQDHVNTVSAEVDSGWAVGRQEIAVNLRADKNRFSRNDYLNNTSGKGKALWNWRAGRKWTGEAGANFARSLTSFANTRFFARDLVDIAEYFGTARLQVGPRWTLIAGLRQANGSHSVLVRRIDDFHSKTGNLGVEYSTPVGNEFSWEYRHTKAKFPQLGSSNAPGFDRDYTEDTARFLVKYALTGKTLIDASGGYLKRNYVKGTAGNFSGNIWRASLLWQPSAKTQLLITGWRELAAYLDSQSDYFISKGGSVSPTWIPTNKLAFSLAASWDDQNYIRSNLSAIEFLSRHDKITWQQASLEYKPRPIVSFTFAYRYEQRDSNRPQFKYDDKQASVGLTVKF